MQVKNYGTSHVFETLFNKKISFVRMFSCVVLSCELQVLSYSSRGELQNSTVTAIFHGAAIFYGEGNVEYNSAVIFYGGVQSKILSSSTFEALTNAILRG